MAFRNPEVDKKYYTDNKDKIAAYHKIYYKNNKTRLTAYKQEWYKKNKDWYLAKKNLYRKTHRDIIREEKRNYYTNNKDKINTQKSIYMTKRCKRDMNFKIRINLRSRIRQALKGNSKSARTANLLGCPVDYFLDYIESQFDDEMSWENHGAWHLDHIKPCASFDLTKPEEQKRCFHYTNLQPLWAEDNLAKGFTQ